MDVPLSQSRLNNFDLIRVAAALQVAVLHGVEHLGLRLPFHELSVAILSCFPGVPIFFIISGFLIAKSYERQSVVRYARNRALRIYPGLWACLAASILSVWVAGYFAHHRPASAQVLIWIGAQMSFVQFYNPEFLRDYGVGVLNGSLWTIAVELQFYTIIPVIVLLYRRHAALLGFTIVALIAVNTFYIVQPEGMARKLLQVTFLPWLYMFMLGSVLHFLWPKVRMLFEGKFVLWIAAYGMIVAADVAVGIGAHGNAILAPYVLVLAGVVLSRRIYCAQACYHRSATRGFLLRSLHLSHAGLQLHTLQAASLDVGGAARSLCAERDVVETCRTPDARPKSPGPDRHRPAGGVRALWRNSGLGRA